MDTGTVLVIVNSTGNSDNSRSMSEISFRTSGSPPVMRIFFTPSDTNICASVFISGTFIK